MKHLINTLILLITLVSAVYEKSVAQDTMEPPHHEFWHRVSVGGNLGLQFGDVTGIVISPDIKIRMFNQFYGGIGFTYQYMRYKDYYYDKPNQNFIDFRSNAYGGRVFLRYYLKDLFDNFLGNLFAHAEYEYLDFVQPVKFDPSGTILDPFNNTFARGNQNIEVNSLFVGAGYSQPVGGRTFLELLILYNLNDTYNSPYSNPVFRVGFGFSL